MCLFPSDEEKSQIERTRRTYRKESCWGIGKGDKKEEENQRKMEREAKKNK